MAVEEVAQVDAVAAVTCVGVAPGADGVDCPGACTYVAAVDAAGATCTGTADVAVDDSTDCSTFTADQANCGDISGCSLTEAVNAVDAHCGADVAEVQYVAPVAAAAQSCGADVPAVVAATRVDACICGPCGGAETTQTEMQMIQKLGTIGYAPAVTNIFMNMAEQ